MMTNLRVALRHAIALLAAVALLSPTPLMAQDVHKALLEGVEAGADKVSIHLTEPVQFNAFTTAEPPRLVVELLDTRYEGASQLIAGKGDFLEKVRAGQFQSEPSPIARVVLYLKKMVAYRARWDGPRLDIELAGALEPAPAAAPGIVADKAPEVVTDAPSSVPDTSGVIRLESVAAETDSVALVLTREARFAVSTTAQPPRLIIELDATELGGAQGVVAGKGALLSRVRSVQFKPAPAPITRVVLDLKKMAGYKARWDGPILRIELKEMVADPDATPAPAETKSTAARLMSVQSGTDSVALRFSREAAFVISSVAQPPRLIVEFDGAELSGASSLVAGKGEVLSRIRSVQFKPAPAPVARVVLDLRRMAGYKARWDGDTLRIQLDAGIADTAAAPKALEAAAARVIPPVEAPAVVALPLPVPAAKPAAMAVVEENPVDVNEAKLPKSMTTDASSELTMMAGAPAPKAAVPSPAAVPGNRPRRDILANLPTDPITLEFDNMDVRDILALLAQKANINVVAGSDVTGSLSLNLRDVAFNEAFLTVLSMRGLVAAQVGENILRVMTPASLSTERSVAVNQTRVIRLKYAKAADVAATVTSVAAAEGRKGKIVVDENTNSLIMTDTLEGIAAAERLLTDLDMRPQQVLIEVKLVEVTLNKGLSLGIQWDYLSTDQTRMFGDAGRTMIGTTKNPFAAASPVLAPFDKNAGAIIGPGAAAGDRGTGVNLPAAGAVGAFTFGRIANNYFLSATLTAAASQGKLKVLSDPKVTTLNGKSATIKIITNIPYIQSDTVASAGAQTTTNKIMNTETGITLEVKPTINADGRVTMFVKPSVKQQGATLSAAGATGAITVNTRETETNVIVQDGGTVVIGGLITDSMEDNISKVPLLGDIPLLGYLFRNKTTTRRRVELLIFVTTKIIAS